MALIVVFSILPFLSLFPLLQYNSTLVGSVASYITCNELNLAPVESVNTHLIISEPVIEAGYIRSAAAPRALVELTNSYDPLTSSYQLTLLISYILVSAFAPFCPASVGSNSTQPS